MDNYDNFQSNTSDYNHLHIKYFNPESFVKSGENFRYQGKLMSGVYGILYIVPDVM